MKALSLRGGLASIQPRGRMIRSKTIDEQLRLSSIIERKK